MQAVSSLEMLGCSQGAFVKGAEEDCVSGDGEELTVTVELVRIVKFSIIGETTRVYHTPASCEMKS